MSKLDVAYLLLQIAVMGVVWTLGLRRGVAVGRRQAHREHVRASTTAPADPMPAGPATEPAMGLADLQPDGYHARHTPSSMQ